MPTEKPILFCRQGEGKSMTDQPIPVCQWCKAKGHETDSMAWGPHTLWDCGSYYIGDSWGPQNAVQSPECKDRVIAQQAAEIGELKRERNSERDQACNAHVHLQEIVQITTGVGQWREIITTDHATALAMSLRRDFERCREEIERLKTDNTTLRNFLASILKAKPAFGELISPAFDLLLDAAQACLKQSEGAKP